MEIILSHQITVIANSLKYPLCSEIAALKLQYLLDPLLDVVTECINKGAEILLSHSKYLDNVFQYSGFRFEILRIYLSSLYLKVLI